MRLGLLGGTFDPIHVGHLDLAHAAQTALALDRVWLVPSRTPPHRTRPHASAAHRFAMTALAVLDETHLAASDLEMDAPGPSYTADTLDRLMPLGLAPCDIFFVTGADAFRDIRSWRAYPALLDRCHFVVVSRGGVAASSVPTLLPELASRMHRLPGDVPSAPSILLLDARTASVSSTDVRQALAEGRPIDGLVPDAVARHIRHHELYLGQPGSQNEFKEAQ